MEKEDKMNGYKRYKFNGFAIEQFSDGTFHVWWGYGGTVAVRKAFREIGRMPPNKYGNFYGREKAGYAACRELIAKHFAEEAQPDDR